MKKTQTPTLKHSKSSDRKHMSGSREKLPYRETTICFIIHKGHIISKFAGNNSYVKFPGGGVDKGETPEKAVNRELKEELKVTVKKLTLVGELIADWHPGWIENDPKRLERYNQFRGEKTYAFIAFFDKKIEYKSDEGDQWEGSLNSYLKSPKLIINFIERTLPNSPANFQSFYKT